jgi:hypothetical protein
LGNIQFVDYFLSRHKAFIYVQCVEGMLETYGMMGRNMSMKIHVLHCHLDLVKKMEMSTPSMKKGFVRIFLLWRNAAVGNLMRLSWLSTLVA